MKAEIYDKIYEKDRFHWWFRGKREIVLALVEDLLPQNEHTLELIDFGCGCGLMLEALASYGAILGADFSEQALDYCKKRFSGPLQKIDLAQPLSEELRNRFHIGVALDILEHIQADDTAASNLFRALRPNGSCIVTVPANPWMWSAHDENCMHVRRYRKKELLQLLEHAGFTVDYISYYNTLLFLPAAALRLFSRLFRLDKHSSLENGFDENWLNRLLYRVFRLEKRWICKRKAFPFGVSLIAIVTKRKG